MSYKIAVASSDKINVDLTFGSANEFIIYNVNGTDYNLLEYRKIELSENISAEEKTYCSDKGNNCGNGCNNGANCSGVLNKKVDIIGDCRCVVCKKIGFNVQKQFEKLVITAFDVDCGVDEALNKITAYFWKIDKHQSLRNIRKEN